VSEAFGIGSEGEGLMSLKDGFISSALNSYAGSGINGFRSFFAENVTDLSIKLAASRIPLSKDFSEALGGIGGEIAGSLTSVPIKCKMY